MTIHLDILTELDERASRAAAGRLVTQFTAAGRTSGEAFNKALESEVARTNIAADQITRALEDRLTRSGSKAGRGFGGSFGTELASALPVVSSFTSTLSGYESAAGKAGAAAGRALGLAFTTAAGGAIGAAAYTLFKGFERYEAIDAAKNRLDNLNRTLQATGKAGLDVSAVMSTVNDVVTGTPFALDKAFSIATRALASNTGDLKRFMTDVADAAGFAGEPIQEIGEAFLKIANQGKVSMDELGNELQNIPIVPWLQDTLKVSGAELAKLVHDGKVGLDDLLKTVEQHASGFAKAAGDTVSGALDNMQTAIARLGANFLGALFGQPTEDANNLKDAIKAITDRINDVGAWVTAHQEDIRQFFEQGVQAAKDLAGAVGTVVTAIDNIPGGISTVVGAFIAWKSIQGVSALTTALGGVNDMLGKTLPSSAESGAARITSALGPVAALAATIAAVTNGRPQDYLGGGPNSPKTAADQGDWGSVLFGDAWPTIRDRIFNPSKDFLLPKGTVPDQAPGKQPFPPDAPFGTDTGQTPLAVSPQDRQGRRGSGPAPAGGDILPPTGLDGSGSGKLPEAPQVPYDTMLPAEFANLPQTAEIVSAENSWLDARHNLAEKRARLNQLESDSNATQDDIIKARNDVINAEQQQNQAELRLNQQKLQDIQVPYPEGYGAAPRPGETAEQYGKEQSYYEAVHKRQEAEAQIQQLQASGTATTADMVQANNALIKARGDEYQAMLRLSDATNKTGSALDGIGAELDKDFGISKGLPGIVENLTKFIGNLAFAPVLGALKGVQAAQGGYDSSQGSGLVGILAQQGVFGPQFQTNAQTSPLPFVPSASPSMGVPSAGAGGGAPYGLPAGSNSGGYGGGGVQFPDWVYALGDAFGVKPSTYPGHQESNRNEPGYAPNPQDLNRGIDWSGPVENMQRFADYLSTIPGALEQVIFENPQTGQTTEIAGGRPQPGYYGQGTLNEHENHVHTRQSTSIPLPGGVIPQGAMTVPGTQGGGYQPMSSAPFGSIPLPLPVTIVGGMPGMPTPGSAGAPPGTPASGQGTGALPGPAIPPNASREQVISGLAARARAEGLSDPEVAGVLALAQSESNFNRTGFLGFSTKTADTGYTGGAPYANDFNKAMDQFFTNYKKGGLAAEGGPQALAQARAALAAGDAAPYLHWLQYGLQGAVPGQGGMNNEFGPNLANAFNQWQGSGVAGGTGTGPAPGPSTLPTPGLSTVPPGGPGPLPSMPSGFGGTGFPGLTPGPATPGAETGPTLIGGLAAPTGGASGGGAGGGGVLGAAAGAAGMAADAIAPGSSVAVQIGIQEINRAIKYAGQVAGIGVQGLMETFLPAGASELAANNWITRIAGGLAGAAPQLPNIAGGKKAPEGLTPEQAAQYEKNQPLAGDRQPPLAPGQGQQPGQPGQGGGNTVNNTVNVNNPQMRDVGGSMRDAEFHAQGMYAAPGM